MVSHHSAFTPLPHFLLLFLPAFLLCLDPVYALVGLGAASSCDWSAWEVAELAQTSWLMRHPQHDLAKAVVEVLEPQSECVPLVERRSTASVPETPAEWASRPWWWSRLRRECPGVEVAFRVAEYAQRFQCFDRLVWSDPKKTSLAHARAARAKGSKDPSLQYEVRLRARGSPATLDLDDFASVADVRPDHPLRLEPGELLVFEATARDPSQCGGTLEAQLRGARLVVHCNSLSLHNASHWILCPVPQHLPAPSRGAAAELDFLLKLDIHLLSTDFTAWHETFYYKGWTDNRCGEGYLYRHDRLAHSLPVFTLARVRRATERDGSFLRGSGASRSSLPAPNACDERLALIQSQDRARCGAAWSGYWFLPDAFASLASDWFRVAEKNDTKFFGDGWEWLVDAPNGGDARTLERLRPLDLKPGRHTEEPLLPLAMSSALGFSAEEMNALKGRFSRMLILGDSTDGYALDGVRAGRVRPPGATAPSAKDVSLATDPFFGYRKLWGLRTKMAAPPPDPKNPAGYVHRDQIPLQSWLPTVEKTLLGLAANLKPTASKPWLLVYTSALHNAAYHSKLSDFLGALATVFHVLGRPQVRETARLTTVDLREVRFPLPALSPDLAPHVRLLWRRPQLPHIHHMPSTKVTNGVRWHLDAMGQGKVELLRAFADALARLHDVPAWDTNSLTRDADNLMRYQDVVHYSLRGGSLWYRQLMHSLDSQCVAW